MNHGTKNIISIILLLVLIIGSGIIASSYLDRSSKELTKSLQKVEQYADRNNWELAKEEISTMEEKWQKVINVWATLTDHAEIDSISSSMSRASKYIEEKDSSPALAELSVLKSLISHIPKKELPSIDNIF